MPVPPSHSHAGHQTTGSVFSESTLAGGRRLTTEPASAGEPSGSRLNSGDGSRFEETIVIVVDLLEPWDSRCASH